MNKFFRSTGCILVLLFICTLLKAQKPIPYVNSIDSINVGMLCADTGAFAKASALYETVSPNDTNYVLALLEDAVAKESSEQDTDAINSCRKGIAEESEYTPDFYNTLATVYLDEGNYREAIKLLQDSVLPAYSNVHKLYYTLGLAQYKMHQFTGAVISFEKAIDLDMYDAQSHYYLGRCCLEQGRLIPALLSLQFYLVLQPQTSRSYTAVGLIEQLTGNRYQYNKSYSLDPSVYHDSAFTELDLMIRSRIAMNKEYKSTTKINYNFVKQIQLFLEQLNYVPNTGNYWMEKYVPFFTGLQQKNFLEPYVYFILASVNNQALQQDMMKNKKKVKEFTKWADMELLSQSRKKEIERDGKKIPVVCNYYDNNMPESEGQENSAGQPTGEWNFYYRHNGVIYSKGKFNETGQRDGKWQWFYNSGALKESTIFSNGKKEGAAELWYENGSPKAKYTFHNDMLEGDCWEYNVSGILTTRAAYKNNKLDGPATFYYDDGKQHFVANYVNGNSEGEMKEYYVTGQLKSLAIMKDNLKNGGAVSWWPNGKKQDSGIYKDNKENGPWRIYYPDGSLQKAGNFNLNGLPQDRWAYYFRKGKINEAIHYNRNGNLDGMDSVFDNDGILYEVLTYKDGTLQSYVFMDKGGKVISSGKMDGKALSMVSYNPEGVKVAEGLYVDNKREGNWKYYNYFGALTATEQYAKGQLNGAVINYFSNGKVKDSVNYTDDEKDGYYVSYHISGKMNMQGWYVNGDKQGDWKYYDLKGNLIKHNFYVNGALHGYSQFFGPNTSLSEQKFYKYGYLDKVFDYDSTGKITYLYNSNKGTGKYLLKYGNGNIIHELNYINGYLEGPEKKYFFNGKLSKDGEYLLDERQGETKAFYENGNVKYIYNYDIGNCEGAGSSYYKNGNLEETGRYYNDELDGEYKNYHENGKLSVIGHCEEGDNEGEYKSYYGDSIVGGIFWFHKGNILAYSQADKNGTPFQRIAIDKGTGNVICHYPNGNPSIQCNYVNGYVSGKRLYYTPEGKLSSEENFEIGYLNGIQKYYFGSDSTLKEVDNYYYGELDGVCSFYYKSGTVEHVESYVLGIRSGPSRYYDKDGKLIKTEIYYNGNEIAETTTK
jgi:uncharacterized protein